MEKLDLKDVEFFENMSADIKKLDEVGKQKPVIRSVNFALNIVQDVEGTQIVVNFEESGIVFTKLEGGLFTGCIKQQKGVLHCRKDKVVGFSS